MKKIILSLLVLIALPLAAFAQDINELLPKAQKGDTQAMVQLAAAYNDSWEDGSAEQAAKWYRKAADAGNAEAMYQLFEAYEYGKFNLDADEDEAAKWLDKAVAKGHGEALYVRGSRVLYDDEAKGVALLTKGAEAGSANAQMYLGSYYNNSWNNSYNPAKAFEWVKKAAQQSLPEAMYTLATFYLKGIGTTPNKAEGLKWLKKAAESDYSTAVEILEWL